MARRKTRTLTELELEIMQVIWRLGEASVQDVRDALKKDGKLLALPSVRTMLSILHDKGYVSRRQEGRGFVHMPRVPRAVAEKRILADIVKRAFKGSAAGLVAALVDTKMVSERELDRIKAVIEEHEKGEGK